jgi:hypothetical protein
VAAAQETRASLEALRAAAEAVLRQLKPAAAEAPVNGVPSPVWAEVLLRHLADWQASRGAEDCPLPELYDRGRRAAPGLTIGRFHDTLRQLHDQEQIYLHPWTGPLYALPDPPYALLVGHEVAYYASRRGA